MSCNSIASLILAAGKGTRTKSDIQKILLPISGVSIIEHVLRALLGSNASIEKNYIILGPELYSNNAMTSILASYNVDQILQVHRNGTGGAVLSYLDTVSVTTSHMLILCGDMPLIHSDIINNVINKAFSEDCDIVVVAFETSTPYGYGRVIADNGAIIDIIEEKDATILQKGIELCNSGIILCKTHVAQLLLKDIPISKATGEIYITKLIGIAHSRGYKCSYTIEDQNALLGVNDLVQRSYAEKLMQERIKTHHMQNGVIMFNPETSYIEPYVTIDKNVVIEQNVVIKGRTYIHPYSHIKAFSYIEDAIIQPHATIGPFAHIRPGSDLSEYSRIGSFVEVKNASVGRGSKVPHLSYVGDAKIGEGCNIGAGVVCCNYDGFEKHQTILEDGAFIGANSTLIAPLTIECDAMIAAGSTITLGVGQDELAIERNVQVNKKAAGMGSRRKKRKK